jgi:hypothetical protein
VSALVIGVGIVRFGSSPVVADCSGQEYVTPVSRCQRVGIGKRRLPVGHPYLGITSQRHLNVNLTYSLKVGWGFLHAFLLTFNLGCNRT